MWLGCLPNLDSDHWKLSHKIVFHPVYIIREIPLYLMALYKSLIHILLVGNGSFGARSSLVGRTFYLLEIQSNRLVESTFI